MMTTTDIGWSRVSIVPLVGITAATATIIWYREKLSKRRRNDQTVTKTETNSVHQRRGGKGSVARSRFRGRQTDVQIVCAPSTAEFKRSIETLVGTGDQVLIIRGKEDKSSETAMIEELSRSQSGVHPIIFEGSIWNMESIHAAIGNHCIDVVCLDPTNMFGNDLVLDSIVQVNVLRSLLQPKTILVKSRGLARHARSFINIHDFLREADKHKLSQQDVEVICAVDVSMYRKTIEQVVIEGDHVLEIGCHHGTTTNLIANATQQPDSVVGVDIGKVCIKRAVNQFGASPLIHFEVVDGWNTDRLLQLDTAFHVIYLDVGGISGAEGLFEGLALIRQLCNAYRSSLRCIVVKSRCLRDHASVWYHSNDWRERVLSQGERKGENTGPANQRKG